MAHRKSGLSMSAMATEIGLSATRVGPLIKRVEVAKRSRTTYFADCGSMQVSSPHLARWAHAGDGVLEDHGAGSVVVWAGLLSSAGRLTFSIQLDTFSVCLRSVKQRSSSSGSMRLPISAHRFESPHVFGRLKQEALATGNRSKVRYPK